MLVALHRSKNTFETRFFYLLIHSIVLFFPLECHDVQIETFLFFPPSIHFAGTLFKRNFMYMGVSIYIFDSLSRTVTFQNNCFEDKSYLEFTMIHYILLIIVLGDG